MKLTKRLFAILLAAAMVFTILPVVALADDPVGTSAISASDFIAYEADGGVAISDYTGTVNSVNFTGIQAVQLAYQPRFYFTAAGVSSIQSYAAANGYDTLIIHVTGANFSNNGGCINNQLWFDSTAWAQMSVDVDSLTSSFYFWFTSENAGTMYLWFEFTRAPIVTTASFTNAYWNDLGNCTYSIASGDYQPHFTFSQAGIDRMQAYAAKWGVDTLRIYGEFTGSNSLVLNNAAWIGQGETGRYLDVAIADMSTSFDIWSQSDSGYTSITLRFEAFRAPIVTTASFTNAYWNDLGNCTYSIASGDYQPHFTFSQAGIDRMQAYASAWDVDTLRIYGEFTGSNCLVLNNACWIAQGVTGQYLDVPIANMTTAFDIWSQSDSGFTQITLRFVPYKAPVVKPAYFTGSGSFSNDTDGTITFASADYQPHYYFTAAGISAIQSYAAANGYDVLRITASFTGTNNCLVINNQAWIGSEPYSLDVPIANLSTSFDFWSQSEGTTIVTMSFEFLHPSHTWVEAETIASTCTVAGHTEYECSVCGETMTEELPLAAHSYTIPVDTILPTCTSQGYSIYACSTCGATQNTDYVAALGHNYVYTDNTDGATHTITCSRCDYTSVENHTFVNGTCVCGASDATLKIKSASVRLDEDIDIIFTVEIPVGYSNPYMVINGQTISTSTVSGGYREFVYTGITPQRMTDNISATLYATKDGVTESDTIANYSIKQYCSNLLTNNSENTALVTLLSDLLTYGAAAQNYTDYKTNDLATAGLTLTPSTFSAISGKSVTFTGTADSGTYWSEATLVLGNTVGVRLYFYTDAQITIDVTIGNSTETFDSGFVSCGNGRYYLDIPGIEATDFDTTITAEFYDNGVKIGNTLGYSVNTYICGAQNSANSTLQTLVRALYNYGASAASYSAE